MMQDLVNISSVTTMTCMTCQIDSSSKLFTCSNTQYRAGGGIPIKPLKCRLCNGISQRASECTLYVDFMFTLSYLTQHPACMIRYRKACHFGIYSGPISRPSRIKCSFSLEFTPTLSVHWFLLSYKRRKKCQTKKVTRVTETKTGARNSDDLQTMQIPLTSWFFSSTGLPTT